MVHQASLDHPEVSLLHLCHVLQVPRASYYRPRPERLMNEELIAAIEKIATIFLGYGYRRITHELRRQGFQIGKKKVLNLMREHSLLVQIKRKWVKTTDSEHGLRRYPNLAKGLVTQRLNELWVSDITYIHSRDGFVYLAAVLDAHSRKVIAWNASRFLTAELVLSALGKAIVDRNPPPGWIHHSDQGVQYACRGYVDLVVSSGGKVSMSGKGKPRDNAKAESFFATLKREEVRYQHYLNLHEVTASMEHFIDDIYNERRLHSSLGYQTPSEFESQALAGGLAT